MIWVSRVSIPVAVSVLGSLAAGQDVGASQDTLHFRVDWSAAANPPDSVVIYATVMADDAVSPEVLLDRTSHGTRDSFLFVLPQWRASRVFRFALSARGYAAGQASPRAVVEWEYPLARRSSAVSPDTAAPGWYTIQLALRTEQPRNAPEPARGARTPRRELTVPSSAASRPESCLNEPPGFEPISDQRWEDGVPDVNDPDRAGWLARSGRARLRVVTDPDAPRAAGRIIEGTFPRGMLGGRGPFRLDRPFERSFRALYMCFWHKLDPAFTNGGNQGTKFGFFLTPYHGTSGLNHYINLTNRLAINLQSNGGKLNRNFYAQFDMMATRGRWHLLEFLLVGNSGEADGIARIWVDGKAVLNQRGVRFFFPGQRPAFSGVTWNPTYGRNPVPRDLYERIGRWYISGRD